MGLLSRKGPSGFSASSTAEEVTRGIDGTGLTAIVTGATSGLGLETSRVLALRGVHVVMAVRNTNAGENVKEAILKEIPNARVDVMELDLSSLASVRKFGEEYNSLGLPLNILMELNLFFVGSNNAGVITPFKLSQDNIELHFATNHLGHFLLTNLLLETMKRTLRESKREGRIVNLSSMCHQYVYREGIRFDKINDESSYYKYLAYGQSKLANVLHANELTRRLKAEGVEIIANSLHPGSIQTNIVHFDNGILHYIVKVLGVFIIPFIKTVQQGAATTCFVALHPQVKGVSGEYFADCNIAKPSNQAKDADLASKLWDFSLSMTNLK
ncbi:short-chain dehydrogenase TIC 32, chloroplastic-like isoform X1 [Rosa rugosa]|uniref:short-chain dehydrogenase TIC 32, chloroplastic-like isoform X1 n=1 Tax=Rosa rugosa TaxID=74645 RepID=UPI002B400B51|nr:short-chain dehydrogenase TIC 32, chloroplastic-like isoform X1 [Rosa rugosa]